jgi:hypothetical protein
LRRRWVELRRCGRRRKGFGRAVALADALHPGAARGAKVPRASFAAGAAAAGTLKALERVVAPRSGEATEFWSGRGEALRAQQDDAAIKDI